MVLYEIKFDSLFLSVYVNNEVEKDNNTSPRRSCNTLRLSVCLFVCHQRIQVKILIGSHENFCQRCVSLDKEDTIHFWKSQYGFGCRKYLKDSSSLQDKVFTFHSEEYILIRQIAPRNTDCIVRQLQGDSEKIPRHENRNISEMRENFCTKFCSFA